VRDAFARFSVRRAIAFLRSVGRVLARCFSSQLVGDLVRWCGYLIIIISPDGCRVYGRRRDASKRRRRLEFHLGIGATPDFRILARRRSLKHRYQSVEAAFSLPSGFFGFRKDFSFRFAGLLTSSAVEKDRKDLVICAAESPFYTRLITRASVFGNYSHRAAVKISERFGSARGSSGCRARVLNCRLPTAVSR